MHIWIFSYILCPVDNKIRIFSNKDFHSDITVRFEPLIILAHFQRKDGWRQWKARNSRRIFSAIIITFRGDIKQKIKEPITFFFSYMRSHLSTLSSGSNIKLRLHLTKFKDGSHNQQLSHNSITFKVLLPNFNWSIFDLQYCVQHSD